MLTTGNPGLAKVADLLRPVRYKLPTWGLRIMRYELSDYDEWDAIKPILTNKPRGVPRNDYGWHTPLSMK